VCSWRCFPLAAMRGTFFSRPWFPPFGAFTFDPKRAYKALSNVFSPQDVEISSVGTFPPCAVGPTCLSTSPGLVSPIQLFPRLMSLIFTLSAKFLANSNFGNLSFLCQILPPSIRFFLSQPQDPSIGLFFPDRLLPLAGFRSLKQTFFFLLFPFFFSGEGSVTYSPFSPPHHLRFARPCSPPCLFFKERFLEAFPSETAIPPCKNFWGSCLLVW